ncbi:MAG: PBP1A family penicillin-binding protein, partial [Deltaproteobacteria bacterium]|nr:PBP1A family penicillin-binding protein [Deltaproteobacteria bacterium]
MKRKTKIIIGIFLCSVFALPAATVVGVYFYFSYDLPRIASLQDYRPSLVTQVFSRQGDLIGEFFVERRYQVTLADIEPLLIEAIIAAEDDRFFQHKGINFWSIIRAAIKNIEKMQIRQGGSTITQQIVKSLLLTPERSFSRKIKEAILALRIEKYLSKDDILTLYLNQIYFGRGAYGVEAAARVYFGKPSLELTLGECSFLAGLPKAPNRYSPFTNPQGVKRRQSYVLTRMVEQGYITLGEKRGAEQVELDFKKRQNVNLSTAPYFVEYIRREIEKQYGSDYLYKEGLRVETTLDTAMQISAREAVQQGVSAYEKREKITDNETRVQAALMALHPGSGHILAMVGGRDYQESEFNRALQAKRQPGSAFKPIIYAAALDKGFTPASIIIDAPLVYEEDLKFWEPQNYDKRFLGPITFRKALTHSRNIVTIKILQDIGVDYVIRYARNLGVEGDFNRDLSLSLGTCGISLLNMVKAYSVFCGGGIGAENIAIAKIIDRDGKVLLEQQPQLTPRISPQTAYIMTTLLQSVVEEGTGRKVRALSRPCAGKTGTTNDVRDALFI